MEKLKNFHSEYEAATTKKMRARIMAKVPVLNSRSLGEMRKQQKERVCDKCGGKLRIRLTVNGGCCSIEYRYRVLVCEHCCCMTDGTTPQIYKLAKKWVRKNHFRPYSHMSEHEYERRDKEEPKMKWMRYFWETQTGGAVRELHYLKSLGVLKI